MNTFKMIKCDEPTVNDRVYLEEEVELAIAKWNKIDYERLGEMNDHNPEPALAINLDRVTKPTKLYSMSVYEFTGIIRDRGYTDKLIFGEWYLEVTKIETT